MGFWVVFLFSLGIFHVNLINLALGEEKLSGLFFFSPH